MAEQAWNGQTGGTHGMQRALVSLIGAVGVRPVYGLMHLWLVWYILVRPSVTRGAYLDTSGIGCLSLVLSFRQGNH